MIEHSYQSTEELSQEHAVRTRQLIPGQMDLALFRENCQHSDQRIVDTFAHGKFPTEDPQKQVILASHLQRHVDAWHEAIGVQAFGLDVARSKSGNETMLAAGGPDGLSKLHPWKRDDVIFHAEETVRIAGHEYGVDLRAGRNPVCVDTDGLGGGTADTLKRLGVWTIEFHGGAPSQVAPRQYGNWRTEAYATLGRRLNPDDQWGQSTWALPPGDTALYAELTAPEKVYPRGDALRFTLSPKRKPQGSHQGGNRILSVEEKLGRSPDRGDATAYLFVAVRTLMNMNELFAEFSGPMVFGSGDDASKGELTQAMEAERKREAAMGYVNGNGNGNGKPKKNAGQIAVEEWIGDLTGEPQAVAANGNDRWSSLFPDDDD